MDGQGRVKTQSQLVCGRVGKPLAHRVTWTSARCKRQVTSWAPERALGAPEEPLSQCRSFLHSGHAWSLRWKDSNLPLFPSWAVCALGAAPLLQCLLVVPQAWPSTSFLLQQAADCRLPSGSRTALQLSALDGPEDNFQIPLRLCCLQPTFSEGTHGPIQRETRRIRGALEG